MRDVALVPQGDVLERRRHGGAHQPGQAGEVFAQHRVALVGHGRRALLAGGEKLLGLAQLAALKVADFDGEVLDGTGDNAEGGEKRRMAVAGNDLGRHRLDGEAELFRHMGLDPGVDIGEGADGARDGAGGDLGPRRCQPLAVPVKRRVMAGELDPEGGRLGVDGVAAADTESELMLPGAALQGGEQIVQAGEQDIGGAAELDGQAGVEHVR